MIEKSDEKTSEQMRTVYYFQLDAFKDFGWFTSLLNTLYKMQPTNALIGVFKTFKNTSITKFKIFKPKSKLL